MQPIPAYLLFPILLMCNQLSAQLPVANESHHKVILENQYLRLLEGIIPAHDTTPPHLHAANSVVVFLSKSVLEIQPIGENPVTTSVHPGDTRYVDYGDKPVVHIVRNRTPGPTPSSPHTAAPILHFYVVELVKRPPGMDTCPILVQPALKCQWKKPAVSCYKVSLPPGSTCNIPASKCARLLIAIPGNSVNLSAGVSHHLQTTGFTFFPPDKPVDVRNNGKTDAQCVLLEIQ